MFDNKSNHTFGFLSGGGVSGELIRSIDWSAHPLGSADRWPQSLKSALNILLNSRFPMFLYWGKDLISFYNDSYASILSKIGKDVTAIGRPGEECWTDTWDSIKPEIDQVLINGEASWSENRSISLTGNQTSREVYLTSSYSPVIDEDGNRIGVFVVCNETSDEIKTLQALKESETNFRNLIIQAPVGILILSGERFIVDLVNDNYLELVGKQRADFINKPLWHGLPEVESQGFDALLKEVMRTGIPYYGKEQPVLVIRNGIKETIYVNFAYEPLKEVNRRSSRIFVIATDVTAQVVSKQQIEVAEERARLAVEAVNLGTFDLNLVTGEMGTSERLDHIFGFDKHVSRADYVGMIHPDDRTIRIKAHRKALETGRIFYEVRVIHKDASIHWVRIEGKVYYGDYDKPIRILGTVQDITMLVKTEEQLLKANQDLQHALKEQQEIQKQKDNFLGIASHELKTPVTSIKAYAQLLEKILTAKGGDQEAGMMRKMDAQINRLTSLITNLLDVTRMNAGQMEFKRERFDLNELVASIAEELQRSAAKHLIVLNLQEVGDIYGDSERLGQVVINLVSNAIKYSPKADRVEITSRREAETVVVCIKDFGIGIAEDKLNKVFEQFYRINEDPQNTFPGIGLGLFISSEIIKREGGKLWVESVIGHGSTFCFSLPLKQ